MRVQNSQGRGTLWKIKTTENNLFVFFLFLFFLCDIYENVELQRNQDRKWFHFIQIENQSKRKRKQYQNFVIENALERGKETNIIMIIATAAAAATTPTITTI